jgi:Flavin reductase like domain
MYAEVVFMPPSLPRAIPARVGPRVGIRVDPQLNPRVDPHPAQTRRGALECRTTAVHDVADHSIVVGDVLGVSESGGQTGPLVDHGGWYRGLADA